MKYGFIYIWFDKKYKRYYVGCHWGREDDNYICSSFWMKKSYKNRKSDFKRRIIVSNIETRKELFEAELYYLSMIKECEIKPNSDNPRYYNLNIRNNNMWHTYEDNIKTVGQKISYANKGRNLRANLTEEQMKAVGQKISLAKKGKRLSEEHKTALKKPKSSNTYSEERKQLISQNSKNFWNSESGQQLKEKRKKNGISKEIREKMSYTHKEKEHKPSQKALQKSIEKCSKTYKVISPNGEEMTITNLKQFCREKGLIDINMVRTSGSKGWFANKLL